MIYIKIAILVALLIFFIYRITKRGNLEMNCWTISYAFLLIELYAIISYTVSGTTVSSIAFPLAFCTMCSATAGYYANRNVRFKIRNKSIRTEYNQDGFESSDFYIGIPGLILFFLLMLVIGTFRYQGIPPIVDSLRALLKGGYSRADAVGLTEARRYISKAHYFGGTYRGQGLTKTLQLTGWPLLCSTTLGIYLNNKRGKALALFIVFFLFGVIYLAGDGTRAPVLVLAIICLITICQKRKVNLVKIAKYGIIILLLLSLIGSVSIKQYSTFSGGLSISSVVESIRSIIERVLLGNTGCDILAINYVSSGNIPVQNGILHLHQFLNALPGVTVSHMTFSYLLGQMAGASATSYYSTTYLGIAYADFGFFGALIAYFVVGAICAITIRHLKGMSETNNSLKAALYACITWEISYIFVRSLVGCLVEIAIVVLLYYLMKLLFKVRVGSVDRLPPKARRNI